MMDNNSWDGYMGWGMWIIPFVVIVAIVLLIRAKRNK